MLRFFEIFTALSLFGAAYGAHQAVWFPTSDVVQKVPKNVRSNPGSYAVHYRTYSRSVGGK